jgi:hypothetical protein
MTHRSKSFVFVFLILVGAHLVLIGMMDIYPFGDLPFHLAAATIHRYYDDPGNIFDQYYAVDLSLQPNVFHFLFCSLDIFPSVETANKIFYMLYVVLLPVTVLLVIKELDGDVRFSLLAFTMLYSYSVSRGFVGYTISIPAVMFTFFLILRAVRRPNLWYGIGLAAMFVGLFFMHAMAALVAILVFVPCALAGNGLPRSRRILLLASVAPVLLLLAAWLLGGFQTGQSLFPLLARYYGRRYFQGLATRVDVLYLDNYHLYEGWPGKVIGLGFSLFIIMWLVVGWLRRRLSGIGGMGLGRARSPWLLFIIILICAILIPEQVGGKTVWALYKRLSVLLMLSLVILGSIYWATERFRSARTIAFTAVALVHLGLWASYFIDFQHENGASTRGAFPDNGTQETLAALIYDSRYRGELMYLSFADYHIVWNRGIAVTPLLDFSFDPIKEGSKGRSLPSTIARKRKRVHLGRFADMDYLLVRGQVPEEVLSELSRFDLTKRRGPWSLYARKDTP